MNQTGKKGLHPLAWVAIGCGALVVVGLVVTLAGGLFVAKKVGDVVEQAEGNPMQVAAEMFVRLNPELDLVDSNPEAGTMTIRNNQTNEEATFNFEDIANGNFSFTTGDGETVSIDASKADSEGVTVTTNEGQATFGAGAGAQLPDWLLTYPGASAPESTYSMASEGTMTGQAVMYSDEDVEKVIVYYEEKLKEEGYKVEVARMSAGGTNQGFISGELADPKRSQVVTISTDSGRTAIGIQYSGQSP